MCLDYFYKKKYYCFLMISNYIIDTYLIIDLSSIIYYKIIKNVLKPLK